MAAFFNTRILRKRREQEQGPTKEPALLSVEGRGFNVEIFYVEDPVSDYVRSAVSTVMSIHDQKRMGDILVFLTGQDDIDAAIQLLTEEAQSSGKQGLVAVPLYSGLPRADQDLVFSPTPRGKRKVIFSTNIAETSLTLEGIVYVIDSGFSKQRFYNPDPLISKMILASCEYGCSEEIITIAAVLSIQSIWIPVRGVQKQLDEAKLRFAAAEGDHVTFLNVYKGFIQSDKSSYWCHKNFINYHAMAVRKAITAGFFANAARLEPFSHNGMYKTVRTSQEVYIHPSSVLFRVNPKFIVYHSLVSTDGQYMRNVITIDPSWLTEAAPHFYQKQLHSSIPQ